VHLSQPLDDKEYAECDNQEVHCLLNEIAIVQRHGWLDDLSSFHHSLVKHNLKVSEVETTDQHTDARHDDVIDNGGDNLAESTADNYTDSHIDHIAFHREVLEIGPEFTFCHISMF